MITTDDHDKIKELLRNSVKSGMLQCLEKKLETLPQIDPSNTPLDLVTLSSEIVVRDSETDQIYELRLVYQISPHNINQVSVLAPLGTALLGSRENSAVVFEGRDSLNKTCFVEKITYQPENSGKRE